MGLPALALRAGSAPPVSTMPGADLSTRSLRRVATPRRVWDGGARVVDPPEPERSRHLGRRRQGHDHHARRPVPQHQRRAGLAVLRVVDRQPRRRATAAPHAALLPRRRLLRRAHARLALAGLHRAQGAGRPLDRSSARAGSPYRSAARAQREEAGDDQQGEDGDQTEGRRAGRPGRGGDARADAARLIAALPLAGSVSALRHLRRRRGGSHALVR